MSLYALVCPVEHGPGFQKAFKGAKSVFYLVEVFVMIEYDTGVHISDIGCNCKESIILLMPFNLLLVEQLFLLLVIFKKVMRCFLFK